MAGEIQLIGGAWGLFGGEPMTDPNCCRACIECESLCDAGTRPPTWDITVDHNLFFVEPDACSFSGGLGGTSPYAGAFELQWLGESIGGECGWYYCDDDPCNPGEKFVWVLTYNLPDDINLFLYYGVEADSCEPADVLAALLATGSSGVDSFNAAGQTETDCCVVDVVDIPWVGATGTTYVTLGGGAFFVTATATGCP